MKKADLTAEDSYVLRQEIKQTDRMSKESKKEETVREIISVEKTCINCIVSAIRSSGHWTALAFSVYEGEFCAIVGTSGSGKSTPFEYACRTGKTDSRGSDRSGEAYRADERK